MSFASFENDGSCSQRNGVSFVKMVDVQKNTQYKKKSVANVQYFSRQDFDTCKNVSTFLGEVLQELEELEKKKKGFQLPGKGQKEEQEKAAQENNRDQEKKEGGEVGRGKQGCDRMEKSH